MNASPRPRSHPRQVPIAIVGISAILPGATDPASFWRNVVDGRDLMSDVPPTHWLVEDYYDPDPSAPDKTYGRRGAFLPPVEFAPGAFGVPPNTLAATDTAQLLALVAAERVLADATGGKLSSVDSERVSVLLGTSSQQLLYEMAARLQRPVWLKSLREEGVDERLAQAICDRIANHYVPWQEATFPGLLGNVIAGRVANRFDLHGTNAVSDAACASSLAALSAGINELALGQADLVLTGGVDTMNDILMYMCFSKTPALSPTGDCRPFSDAADGTMLGEGLVMFALKRLADAETDGDQVYGVIRGMGSSSDGRGGAIYAPMPLGQARALRRAYEAAGYGPDTVGLIEAHGTGTTAGDVAEVAALRDVFESTGRAGRQWCALGSVKSQIGHTKSTAGAVGLLKAVFALQHKVFPPTIKVERPNPKLDLENSPFYLSTAARPWVAEPGQPRRAGVSSFGFGGSNFHVTVEEYQPSLAGRGRPAPRARTAAAELVLFSAASADELLQRVRDLAAEDTPLPVLARRSQREFRFGAAHRLAVVASDTTDLNGKLRLAVSTVESRSNEAFATPNGVHYGCAAASTGALAILFSGQGSQYVGMGAEVAMQFPQAQAVWDSVAELSFDGMTVPEVVFPLPVFTEDERAAQEQRLTATEWAQPALAVQSMALLAVLTELGLRPECFAGHSFGELVALHAAGVFDARNLVALARRRGELMRDASEVPGAMVAVTAPLSTVEALVGSGRASVWVANHNAPNQVVISGRTDDVSAVEAELTSRGITARRLAVSTAFHTPLVAPAANPLREFLQGIDVQPPRYEVYANADAAPYSTDPDGVRDGLARQLGSTVRFVDEIEAMYARGVRTFVEVGAGRVLTDLVGQILDGRPHAAVSFDRKGRNGVISLFDALAQLAVAGVRLNFNALWSGYAEPVVPEKAKPAITMMIDGANYGRPYPPAEGAVGLPSAVPAAETSVHIAEPAAGEPLDAEWLTALQAIQEQTAQAHAAYEQAMAESHQAYLRMVHNSLESLGKGLTDLADLLPPEPQPSVAESMVPPPMPIAPVLAPTRPQPVRAATLPEPEPALPEPEPAMFEPEPALAAPAAAMAVPPPPPPPPPPAPPSSDDGADLAQLMIAIVAERTGYPAEMLSPDQEMEADLGIDSIKRVEILAALRKEKPDLPELTPADLGTLRTIGQIAGRLGAAAPVTGHTAAPAGAVPPAAPALPPLPDTAAAGLVRLVVRTAAVAEPGYQLVGLDLAPLVVTDDGNGVAARIVEALAQHGVDATVVNEVPRGARGVVFLGGLRAVNSLQEAQDVNREAFRVARTVAPVLQASGGVFVTVQDTGGDFGLSGAGGYRPWLGGLAALARTAAKEWPLASVKAIDCASAGRDPQAVASALVRELLLGGSTLDVGLRADGERLTLEPAPAPSAPVGPSPVGPDSLLVVSGGARGVTAAALIALARRHRPRLVLLGRTPLLDEDPLVRQAMDEGSLRQALIELDKRRGNTPTPSRIRTEVAAVLAGREVRRTLQALEAAGAPTRYLTVDVSDGQALTETLQRVRADWGPITGVVHGAGVLADKLIADQTDEQYERVFRTKVDGLRALLDATEQDPLTLLVVFTSVSAKVGNPGQSAYAMANSVISQVASAQAKRRPGCLVKAIAWGPWDGGMVGPELGDHFRRQGVSLIGVAAGAAAFLAELESRDNAEKVIIGAGGSARQLTVAGEHLCLDLRVGRRQAYLVDHSIAGTPVVPVALALDWLIRASGRERQTLEPAVLRDVRVLRGIGLTAFADQETHLQIGGRVDLMGEQRLLRLQLRGEDGVLYYRADVGLSSTVDAPRQWSPPTDLEPLRRSRLYDGHVLFHGSRFQFIQTLDGVSPNGAAATVNGLAAADWAAEDWQTDPAAVDGALQVALLWGERVLGGACLPMAVAEYRVWRRGTAVGAVRCVIRAKEVAGAEASCDIGCLDEDGALRTELLGVELIRRPDDAPRTADVHMPSLAIPQRVP